MADKSVTGPQAGISLTVVFSCHHLPELSLGTHHVAVLCAGQQARLHGGYVRCRATKCNPSSGLDRSQNLSESAGKRRAAAFLGSPGM